MKIDQSPDFQPVCDDYEAAYRDFSIEDIESRFTWHETGEVNIVYESVDRWVRDGDKGDRKALIYYENGFTTFFTYSQLREASSQWANLFLSQGITAGDRVCIALPSRPEIYFAALGCARIGAVFCILPDDLRYDEALYRIENPAPRGLVALDPTDMVVAAGESVESLFLLEGPASHDRATLVPEALPTYPKRCPVRFVLPTAPLYVSYVSGVDAPPKGVTHCHLDMLTYLHTAESVLNLKERTVIRTDPVPSSATGLIYGALAPWLCGSVTVMCGEPFSPVACYTMLEKFKVEVWRTTPSRISMLMQAGGDLASRYDLTSVKHIVTGGEYLTQSQWNWTQQTFGKTIHQTWSMTETGAVCIADFLSAPKKLGSMGRPVPGVSVAILDDKGHALTQPAIGELALDAHTPGLMTGLWGDSQQRLPYFRRKGKFLTGDLATRDEAGYYYFQGRTDDSLKMGDRRLGPYDIEEVTARHPFVGETCVITVPRPGGEIEVKVFISPARGHTPSVRMKYELEGFVRSFFPSDLPPLRVVFLERFPKTRSRKTLRRMLRVIDHGFPLGNIDEYEE
jgi:acetyl-CoA synthetase